MAGAAAVTAPPDDLLDGAPCGFLSFADDGTVTAVNGTLLEMLGYTREELLGHHIETVLALGSRIFYQTHLFPLVKLHGEAREIFLLLRAKGGDDVGVLANVKRRERDGKFANDCVFILVSERRKYEDALLRAKRAAEDARAEAEARGRELVRANELLEEQATELEASTEELHALNEMLLERTEELGRERARADEASRAKSTFLTTMSHELRTPLNAIGGYAQLLELGVHGPLTDAQRDALARVQRSQQHLLGLINDILHLARIEAGRVEYRIEALALREVVDGVMPMIEPQLDGKSLACAVDVPDGVSVRADREKLQQVLLNLLSNAMKFTPPGGRVSVSAERSPEVADRILLHVADTGVGIPAERIESMFDPFVQVPGQAHSGEGTGLGLTISRDLARGMGGDLQARSIEGHGSVFTITLPIATAS